MKRTNELQQKIIEEMALKQVRNVADVGEKPQYLIDDDETPLFTYAGLERELKESRARLRVEMHELKNEGIVVLSPAVNVDYMPNGSGWMLTEKALGYLDDEFAENI